MATNEIMTFTLEVEGVERAINSIDDLEQAIRDVRSAMDANKGKGILDNTALDQNLRRLQNLREEAKKTQAQIKQTGVDGAKSMSLLREGADGAGSALEILSGENSKVGFVVMSTMKAIGVANSIREVSENRATIATIANTAATKANIVIQNLYNASILRSIISLNTFKIALISTGVGALVVGLGYLISAFMDTGEEAEKTSSHIDAAAASVKALDDSLRKNNETADLYIERLRAIGAAESVIQAVNMGKIQDEINVKTQRRNEILFQEGLMKSKGLDITKKEKEELRLLNEQLNALNYRWETQKTILKNITDLENKPKPKTSTKAPRTIEQIEQNFKEMEALLDDFMAEGVRLNEADEKLAKDKLDRKIREEKETADFLKKLRDDELRDTLQNSKDYFDAEETLLINRAALGYDVSEDMKNLELQRLEAQKQALMDYGESTIEIEKQIAQKKKEIRDAERADVVSNINAGMDVLRASIQSSMELENVRKENALKNTELTEEQREKIAKESFEKQKRLQLQMAYVDAAKSITSIIAQYPKFDGGIAMFAALATTAILNTSAIARIMKTQYEGGNPEDQGTASSKFARGGLLIGPRHSQGGIKTSFGELEGGEFVVNRNSTRMYPNLISAINMAGGGKKFAMGGMIGVEEQLRNMERGMKAQPVIKTYVLSGDISSTMEAEQKLRYRTTM